MSIEKYRKIIERFTGPLVNCTQVTFDDMSTPPIGSYAFFAITAKSLPFKGEVCLYATKAPLIDPLNRSSESSPVIHAEQQSGKNIDNCFVIKNTRMTIFTQEGTNYCLYRLNP